MFEFFKKAKDVDVPELGILAFKDGNWITNISVGNMETELCIDGDKSGPDDFAVKYSISNLRQLSEFWQFAIKYAQEKLKEKEAPFAYPAESFVLNSIAIHRENSFDDGHLSFWFDLDYDPDGTYYISFVNESPSYLHRDG